MLAHHVNQPGAEGMPALDVVAGDRRQRGAPAAGTADLGIDQLLAQSLFHFVDTVPGQLVGDIQLMGRAADPTGRVGSLQQADAPVAEPDLAVNFDPKIGLWR